MIADALWRPLGRGDRALAHRPMVCRRGDAGEAGDRGGALRRHPGRPRRPGRRPGSTGSRISSPGASRASSGGGTRSRPGMTTGNVYVAETEAEAQAQAGAGRRPAPRSGRARHLVLLGALAVRDLGLAGADRDAATPLSQRRADLRLRHHLLLGCPDGDAGLPLHEARARGRRSISTAWSATPRARRCPSRRAIRSIRSA